MSRETNPVWVFTFGAGQYAGLLAEHFVEIQAPSEMQARLAMVEAFGSKWSMCYTQEDFEANYNFPTQRLGRLDQHGNILVRGI